MKAELRADGKLHISGYVNVPGRASRPVMTPHGMVIEVIEQRAFSRAIERSKGINMLLDHDHNRILASTADNTLSIKEDAIGPYARAVISDPTVIDEVRAGNAKGWSFNIKNPVDEVETRANGLPVRHIKDFDMDEITLVVNKIPVYSSTSIELRAEGEESVEYRAIEGDVEVDDQTPDEPEEEEETSEEVEETEDKDEEPEQRSVHADYLARIEALK